MLRHKAFAVRLTLAALATLILTLTAAWALAWQQAHSESLARLDAYTAEVARRSADARMQELELVARLRALPTADTCSAEYRHDMRLLGIPYSYIKGAGVLDGTRLLCATLVDLPVAQQLGQPFRVSPDGQLSWNGVQLPGLPGLTFKVDGRQGFAVFMIARDVVDVLPLGSAISVAHISTSTEPWKLIRRNGEYDFQVMLERGEGRKGAFWSGDQLLAGRVIDSPPALAVAAMPRVEFDSEVRARLLALSLPASLIALLLVAACGLYLRHRLSPRAALQQALRRNEFHMVYQPVVELSSGRCTGCEALVRWLQRDGRYVSPALFIPEAEHCGLICEITEQVLHKVAEDAGALLAVAPDLHIAVNLSAQDLTDPGCPQRLQRFLQHKPLQAGNLVLEITESGLLQPEIARDLLVDMRRQGIRIAIDDFGTGHSSLSYLATYELDYLKIDKRFVDALGEEDGPGATLAFHVIGIAKSLGLQMIAEGIETPRQLQILREAGVQYGQGWLFARPMAPLQLIEFLRGGDHS